MLAIFSACWPKLSMQEKNSEEISSEDIPLSSYNYIQWNLDLTSLYIIILMKSWVQRTFFSPAKVIVKCIKQNLDLTRLDITKSSL